ncbi:AAA family ATPase [Methylorubrum extorquens]|uniref:AAA family ATPase n=1 Tax=Methylorubrum extorquens TaxID=408 RepID=A0AAX3WNA7_METEX|nr:AAA family ATPase [Methylorubrum extorquens]WHQ71996.1 AAA family ATPase [Methylorubrum extorquens]
MTSLRINRLGIEAFRGITGRLELDLRSPLTLVYASNGTGKTTLCDAAEWLMTAAVERLSVRDAAGLGELRSGFAPDALPRVDADIVVDGVARVLERGFDGASIALAGEAPIPVGPNDLLAILAPDGAGPGRHQRNATALRRQWLRGARFLSVETLAALLDTDDETVERRRRVFSDLLGVREQADAKDRIRQYADALRPTLALLTKETEKARAAVDATRAGVGDDPGGAASSREIEAVERELGLTPTANRLETAAAELARRRQALTGQADALQLVMAEWRHRRELRRTLESEEAAARAAATATADSDGGLRQANARVRDMEADLRAAELRGRKLEDLGANLSRQLSAFTTECEFLAPDIGLPARPTLQVVREAVPHARWPTAHRVAVEREIQGLLGRYLDIQTWSARQAETEAALAEMRSELRGPEEIQSLADALSRAEHDLAAAVERLEREAGPVQRLRAAGEAFLRHDHDATQCPTCGHDWQSHGKLLAEVQALMDRTPAFVAVAQESVDRATLAMAACRLSLSAATQAAERERRLTAELAQLRQNIARFERSARSAGLDPEPAATFEGRLRKEAACLRLAASLLETDGLGELLATSFGVAVDERASLPVVRSRLDREIAERAAAERLERQRIGEALDGARSAVAALVSASSEQAAADERARERRASMQARLDALGGAWARLAGQRAWTEANLASVRSELADETARLERAEAHIAAADAALARENRSEGLAAAEADLSRLQAQLDSVTRKQAAADRAYRAFETHYQEASRRQVEALRDTVNPLFARMHANKVYDSIGFGEGDDLLRWRSDIGGRSFDPGRNFSQGQRQDLALALFIARARSLGGTFFLDEPVIHLDDVNRVGLLDVLRASAISGRHRTNLVVTTSSRAMARHLIEKFDRVDGASPRGDGIPILRVYELRGNGRDGVESIDRYPPPS